ncbi:hypothetical protein [uncultured Desulfosarcina sp.]|uniref:hypothetical protein n=1 Tax=uncultured Desulfosarcina sp. TaxID=218289 RepID=UPI0029C62008|nr:hypothetical protein [uncultured Desulfosarcina sp.]
MNNRYNILYLEHDEERERLKNNLEKNLDLTSVQLISPVSSEHNEIDKVDFLDKIRKALSSKNFDLVITDAFFLPENLEHPEYGEGINCIHDITKLILHYSPSTKIVVYTHFKDVLIDDLEDLNIYEIWNKGSTPLNYLLWRIEKTLKEPWNIIPGQLLVDTLKKYLISKNMEPWEHPLYEMLNNYSPQLTAFQNLHKISENFGDISSELKIPTTQFANMLDTFIKQDYMSLISSPGSWSHAKHVFNVFWLGYYILNCVILDIPKNKRKLYNFLRLSEKEKKDIKKYINRAWIIASIFHDYGIIGEKLFELVENNNNVLKEYPWYDEEMHPVKISTSHSKDELREILKKSFEELKGVIGEKLINQINDEWNNKLNHGILSALTIRKNFYGTADEGIKISINEAAKACSLHKIPISIDNRVKYSDYPLACILRFCDEIQTWERETGLETIENPIAIQKVVLSEIKKLNDNTLKFKIEYLPRKDIGFNDSKNNETRKELKKLLDKKTIIALDSIDWEDSNLFLSVEFIFRGKKLREWKNN